jgi:hypothetical protein
MPDEADFRGARARPPADSAREGRRSTRDAGDDSTRDFFEQIGQFSTSRLWRQKVGIAPSLRTRRTTTKGAPEGALRDCVTE